MENSINSQSMLPIGTLLQGGKYRIERYLSSGGFGNTYVATNIEFEEQVAIKEFFMRGVSEREGDSVTVSVSNKDNVTQFSAQKEKFRKEARRLRKLRNPHIVAVHDLFEENGTAYYEMDLIKGESLSERMKRTGLPLAEQEALHVLDQVLDALQVVHAQDLYHLDLKPANIMVDGQGRALLIDFGASKQMSQNDGYSVSTSSALAFTPGYAPLEQTEQNLKSFGPWTDLYALGATLYKLLTGLTPPSASELLVSREPLVFPTPVSSKTQQLIAWMMKPAYIDRPQSVSAVRQFLSAPQPVVEEPTLPVHPGPAIEDTEVMEKPKPQLQPLVSTKTSALPVSNKSGGSKMWWGIGFGIVAAVVVSFQLLKGSLVVTAVPSCPDSNHPHMIDLGLPSGAKWACCNVGATSPEQSGNYYAWGETQYKSIYYKKTYQYLSSADSCYWNIGSNIAGTQYDAATANWGAPWRMPSVIHFEELINSCTSTWASYNGVKGRQFTGPNGNSIFFPAAGFRYGSEMSYPESSGSYWSSLHDHDYSCDAWHLDFSSGDVVLTSNDRLYGFSVRPVR